MLSLFPEIKPYARHRLAVDEPHELYIDESGEQDGLPLLFLHGGPGSGCAFDSRRFFDPGRYRILLLDQRGSGRSTPAGELNANTTAHLVQDMEQIREFLGVKRWVLCGVGWGATLALVYTQAFPETVSGLILCSTFLGRQQDIDWFIREGTPKVFPDDYADLLQALHVEGGKDLLQAVRAAMQGDDELVRMAAAKAWSLWEARSATLRPDQLLRKHLGASHRAMSRASIGTHYFSNQCFLEDDQIIRNMHRLAAIPGYLVHGRFDAICPFSNAFELHHAWPGSRLYIAREACHATTEPPIVDALIRATNDMARDLNAKPGRPG